MKRTKVKVSYAITIIMVLALLTGSYFGIRNLFEANRVSASTKTYEDGEEDIDVEIEDEKLQKDEKYVLEDDDCLIITGTDVDVSGKTFKQVKKEMKKEAEKNGGIIVD